MLCAAEENRKGVIHLTNPSENDCDHWDKDDVFSNTAWFYARFRPGYPQEVFEVLRRSFGLSKNHRVLDLGCGTGQIALGISYLVNEVFAVDPQDDMLAKGRALARMKGIGNIRWLKGDSTTVARFSEDFGSFDLATIARAFHWMKRKQVLDNLHKVIRQGGGVAVIGDSPLGKSKPLWWEVVDSVVKKWLGEERKAGTKGKYKHPTMRHEVVLQESSFRDFSQKNIYCERYWSIDDIIGYLYSTSYCSLRLIGDRRESFEKDLRECLLHRKPDGVFQEDVTVEIMMVFR
jgi:ubiquinone/menaquinone biosynthesis C-methylase UbiE